MTRLFHHLALFILLVMISMTSGCSCQPLPRPEQTDLSAAGFLSLFLNNSTAETQLHISLSDIEIFAEPQWLPLATQQNHTDSAASQQLIATAVLATDLYTRIRFQLTITDPAGKLIRQEQTELPLPQPLEVKHGSSHCLFINNQLKRQHLNRPLQQQLHVWPQQRPLADELLYILCPEIQTLYVARVAPYRIVAAYGIGEDIADMVLDNQQQILYLLDRRYRLIQKFDAISQTLTDRIPLPLTDRPSHLGISADGNILYVSDPVNRQLLQVDAHNGILLQQRTTSYQPGRLYPFNSQQQPYLAVLYPGDQQLQVISAQTLTPLYSINAGLQPDDLTYSDQALFISDLFSRQILKIDPLSGQTLARIATPFTPGVLASDQLNRNLLIGSCQEQTIAFLPFGQQLVARRTAAGGCPADLALARQRQLLFVALGEQQQVTIIDLPSEKQIGTLSVPAQPSNVVFREP